MRRQGVVAIAKFRSNRREAVAKLKHEEIDYKRIDVLAKFITPTGKIEAARRTGASRKQQTRVVRAIKRARYLALLPFTVDDARFEIVGGVLKLKDGVSLDYEAAAELTLVITATLIEDQSPQELHFPLHLPFKLRDARQALKILLGTEDPEDDSELYKLAYGATGKQFTLLEEHRTDRSGQLHVNRRVESAEEELVGVV